MANVAADSPAARDAILGDAAALPALLALLWGRAAAEGGGPLMTTADPRQKQSYECETVAAARTIVSGRRTGRRQAATVTQTNFWRIFWIPVGEVSIQAGMADRHVSVRPHRCGLPAPARPGPPGAAVLAGASAGGGGATAGRWGPRQPRPPLRRNPGPGASAPDPHPDFTFFRRRLPTCDLRPSTLRGLSLLAPSCPFCGLWL